MSDTAATWHDLFSNLGIFKDAILAGGLAGALLGFLGVHVVLRRMVFASSAIAQAAALGVALSFWVPAVIDPAATRAAVGSGAAEQRQQHRFALILRVMRGRRHHERQRPVRQ